MRNLQEASTLDEMHICPICTPDIGLDFSGRSFTPPYEYESYEYRRINDVVTFVQEEKKTFNKVHLRSVDIKIQN